MTVVCGTSATKQYAHTSCKTQTKNVLATVISQHVIAPGRFAKDWECSFDKGWTSVRTDPNKLVQHPVTLSRAFCNRLCLRKSIRRRSVRIKQVTPLTCIPTVEVRAQAELMNSYEDKQQTQKLRTGDENEWYCGTLPFHSIICVFGR